MSDLITTQHNKWHSRKFYAFIISMFLIMSLVILSAFLDISTTSSIAISTIGVITSAFIGFVGYQDIQKAKKYEPPYAIPVGFQQDDNDV